MTAREFRDMMRDEKPDLSRRLDYTPVSDETLAALAEDTKRRATMAIRGTCPFCGDTGEREYCQHLMGWTDDGKTLEPVRQFPNKQPKAVLSTDVIVTTGVSARVFRDVGKCK